MAGTYSPSAYAGEDSYTTTSKKGKKKRKKGRSLGGLVGNFAGDIEDTVRAFGPGIGAFLRDFKYDVSHPSGLGMDLGSVLLPPLAVYNIARNRTHSRSLGKLMEGMSDSWEHNYGPLIPFYGDPWQTSAKRMYKHPLGPVLDALSVVTLGGAGVARAGSAAAKSGRVSNAVRGAGAGADALTIMQALSPIDRLLIGKAGLAPKTQGALARARKAGALPSDLLRGGDLFVPATRQYAKPRGPLAHEMGIGGYSHVLKDPNFFKEFRKASISGGLDLLPAGTKVVGSNVRRARFDTKAIDLGRRNKQGTVDAVLLAAKRMRPQEVDAAIARHMDVRPSAIAQTVGHADNDVARVQAARWADTRTGELFEQPSARVVKLQKAMAKVDDDVFTEAMLENGFLTPEQIASNAMRPKRIYEQGATITPLHPSDKTSFAHPVERVQTAGGERAADAADEWVRARIAAVEALRRQADDLDVVGGRSSTRALKAQKAWEGRVDETRRRAAKPVRDGYRTRELNARLAALYNRMRYGPEKPTADMMRRFGKERRTIDKMLARAEARYRRASWGDLVWAKRNLSDAEAKLHQEGKKLTPAELHEVVHGRKPDGPVSQAEHLRNIIDNKIMTRQQREHAIAEMLDEPVGFDDDVSLAGFLGISDDEARGILHQLNEGASGSDAGAHAASGGASAVLDRHMYAGLASEGSYRRADWIKDASDHYVKALASGEESRLKHFLNELSDSEEAVLNELLDLDEARYVASHGHDEFVQYADEWFAKHGFSPDHIAGLRRRARMEDAADAANKIDDFDAELDFLIDKVERRAPKLAKKIKDRTKLTAPERKRLESLLRTADHHRAKSVQAAVTPYQRKAAELRRQADRLEARTLHNKRYLRMVEASRKTMPAKLDRAELVTPDGKALYRDLDVDRTEAQIRDGSTARYMPMSSHASRGGYGGRNADSPTIVDPAKTQTILKRNTGRNTVSGKAALDLDAYTRKAGSVIRFDAWKQSYDKMVERGIPAQEAHALLDNDEYVVLLKKPAPGLRRRIERADEAQTSMERVIENLDLGDDTTTKQLVDELNAGLRLSSDELRRHADNGDAVIVPRSYVEAMMAPYAATNRIASLLNKGMDVWRYFVLNLVPRWVVNDVVGAAFMVAVKHSGPGLWNATHQYLRETGQHAGVKRWAALAKRDAKRLEAGVDSPSQHGIDSLLREHYSNIFGNSFIGTENTNNWLTRAQRKKMGTAIVRAATAYPDAITWMDRMFAGDVPRMIVAWKVLTKEAKAAAKLHPDEYAALSNYERVAKLLDDPRYVAAKDRVNSTVLNDLIDYGSLSKFEREWLRGVIPFYSWLRGITVWSKDLMLDQPVRANMIYQVGQQGIEENESYGLTRPYMRGYFKIGDNKYVNTAPLNPLSTLGENIHAASGLWRTKPTYGSNPIIHMNPLLRGFFAASTPGGKDPFSGAQILNPLANPYVERGADGGAGTWPGRFTGSFVNGLPPVDLYWKMREGSRKHSVYDMRGRDYLYNYLGYPVKKVDEDVASEPVKTRMVF